MDYKHTYQETFVTNMGTVRMSEITSAKFKAIRAQITQRNGSVR